MPSHRFSPPPQRAPLARTLSLVDPKGQFPAQSKRRLIEKPVQLSHAVGREGDVLECAQQQIESAGGKPIHIAPVAEQGERSRAAHEPIERVAVLIQGGARPEGETVTIAGFGPFSTRSRPARPGRNPRTGETTTIAASITPSFKAGKTLRDAVR